MNDSDLKLLKSAGLEVLEAYYFPGNPASPCIRADAVAKLLREAPVVYGLDKNDGKAYVIWRSVDNFAGGPATHSAKLICITPIVKDTAESLLREFVEIRSDNLPTGDRLSKLHERAKALLEGEK